MEQYTREKIKVLSFFLIVFVLINHSPFPSTSEGFTSFNDILQNIIGEILGGLAPALFFLISGYLFFQNIEHNNSWVLIKNKIIKRMNTLLLPYFIACSFFVVLFLSIELLGFEKYMNFSVLPYLEQGLGNILKVTFWKLPDKQSPLAFQLWFLRDLIIIVLLTPLIFFLTKKLKFIFPLIIFILSGYYELLISSLLSSIFWFSLGAYVGINHLNIKYKNNRFGIIIMSVYLLISLCEVYFDPVLPELIYKLTILIGVISIWFIYDVIVPKKFSLHNYNALKIACSFTYFIYLDHEPILNIIRKVIVIIIGKSSTGYAISYLTSPFIFVLISIAFGLLLQKHVPKIYSLLVGGR